MSDGGSVTCGFSMCSTECKITKAQKDAGGYWLCPKHRTPRDHDLPGGWGFVGTLEIEP